MTEVPALALHLRKATKAAHSLLDHHPLLMALPGPTLSLETYGRALAALHGAHRAIESRVAAFAPAVLFPRRLADMESDLAALGVSPRPLTVEVPLVGCTAEMLGMLYVIEGSNMGGIVIARQLALSLPGNAPRAFFGGAEGSPRWQRFWAFAHPRIEPEDFDLAAMAASATFAFYRQHLDYCLREP